MMASRTEMKGNYVGEDVTHTHHRAHASGIHHKTL